MHLKILHTKKALHRT